MSETNVQVKLEANGNANIRFGELPFIPQPKAVEVEGNIFAPLEWFKKKWKKPEGEFVGGFSVAATHVWFDHNATKEECHLLVNQKEGSITLNIQEYNPRGCVIKGKLEPHYALSIFPVNKEQKLTLTDFQNLVRRNALWFKDQDARTTLLTNLNNLKGSVNKTFENANDNKGNTTQNLATRVELGEVKLNFTLSMPLYVGEDNSEFEVEVYINSESTNLAYELVSPALIMLLEAEKQRLLKLAIGEMDKVFAVIQTQKAS